MFRWGIVGLITVVLPAGLAAQGIEFSASGSASTEEKPKVEISSEATAPPADTPEPAATTGTGAVPESFDGKLEYGHSLYLKGDFAGARDVYNMAKEIKSNDPLVLYFIACAEARLGQYDAAISALKAMKTLSGEKLASLTARSLFLTAVVEEMRKDDEKAVAAWREYKAFVEGHTQIPGFVGTAEARLAAYEKKSQLYEQYEVVRQRLSAAQ